MFVEIKHAAMDSDTRGGLNKVEGDDACVLHDVVKGVEGYIYGYLVERTQDKGPAADEIFIEPEKSQLRLGCGREALFQGF